MLPDGGGAGPRRAASAADHAEDHIPEEYARLRIQAQKPDSYYREHCTDVLENQEETPEALDAGKTYLTIAVLAVL